MHSTTIGCRKADECASAGQKTIETKTLTFDQAHLERVRRQADWASRHRGYLRGVLPIICVARAPDTQLIAGGVLIVSPDRLLDAILAASAAA